MEILLLRRLYRAPELFQLLATFGAVLVIADLTLRFWGAEDLLPPRPPGLRGAVEIAFTGRRGQPNPSCSLVLRRTGRRSISQPSQTPAVLDEGWRRARETIVRQLTRLQEKFRAPRSR